MDADLWNAGERQSGGRKEVHDSTNYVLNAMQISEERKNRFGTKKNATE